jgi:hypothetical protein
MTFAQVEKAAAELGVVVERIPRFSRRSFRGYMMWKDGDGSMVAECRTLDEVRENISDFLPVDVD